MRLTFAKFVLDLFRLAAHTLFEFCLSQAPTLPLPPQPHAPCRIGALAAILCAGHPWPSACTPLRPPKSPQASTFLRPTPRSPSSARRHNKSPLNTQRGHPERWEALATTSARMHPCSMSSAPLSTPSASLQRTKNQARALGRRCRCYQRPFLGRRQL